MTALEIRPRPIPSDHGDDDLPHLFMDGDLLITHMSVISSSMFPEGEDFFVRSVRRFRDQVTDPELRRQVAGFIGQEATHSRAHEAFNAKLAALGYPTAAIDRGTGVGMRAAERVLSAKACLALTAALEHFTATLAEQMLDVEEHRALYTSPAVRDLFTWHSLEESEHKAVAFDVYRAVGGSEWLRILVMRLVMAFAVSGLVAGVVVSAARDREGRRECSLRDSWRHLRRSPYARKAIWTQLRSYNRRGFHPDDHDTTALVLRWRDQLGSAA
jgi:predicted metal-dependent hydrolase